MPVQLDRSGGAVLRDKIQALGVEVLVGEGHRVHRAGEQARHRLRFRTALTLRPTSCCSPPVFDPPTPWPANPGWTSGSAAASASTTAATARIRHPRHRRVRALWQGRIFGPVAPGYQMARAAVASLCGGEPLHGADMSTKLKLMGGGRGLHRRRHAATAGAQELLLLDRVRASTRSW